MVFDFLTAACPGKHLTGLSIQTWLVEVENISMQVASLSENRNNESKMHLSPKLSKLLLNAEFGDIEHLCDTVQLWDLDLRPIASRAITANAGKLVQIAAGDLSYGFCSLGANFDQHGASPPGMITFVVMEPTIRALWWRGRDHTPEHVLVYRPGDEMRSVSSAGFEIQTISAAPEFIEGMCADLRIEPPKLDKASLSFHVPAPALHAIRQKLREFRANTLTMTSDHLEEILRSIVGFWADSDGSGVAKPPHSRARDMAVRRCLELFDASNTTDVSLRQMCKSANVSERTLIYAFMEQYGMSPKSFLKARQLSEARHRLKSPEHADAFIGDVAAELGFFHHGHFTSDYKLQFGETPTETRKSLRN